MFTITAVDTASYSVAVPAGEVLRASLELAQAECEPYVGNMRAAHPRKLAWKRGLCDEKGRATWVGTLKAGAVA